jgi:hypothetical protein
LLGPDRSSSVGLVGSAAGRRAAGSRGEHKGRCPPARVVRDRHQSGRESTTEQEYRNAQHLDERAIFAHDWDGSCDHEAAGDLGDEQPEQRHEGAAVHITGGETEHHWYRPVGTCGPFGSHDVTCDGSGWFAVARPVCSSELPRFVRNDGHCRFSSHGQWPALCPPST